MNSRQEELNEKIKELKLKRSKRIVSENDPYGEEDWNDTNDFVSPFDPELGYVTDPEEIRQIALESCKTGDKSELHKIHPMLEVYGLYPEIMKMFFPSPARKFPEQKYKIKPPPVVTKDSYDLEEYVDNLDCLSLMVEELYTVRKEYKKQIIFDINNLKNKINDVK